MQQPLIMIIGVGELGSRLLTMLLSTPHTNHVVLAGRDVAKLTRTANLARFTATNLGLIGDVQVAQLDLNDIDATAETIATLRPDIIFMSASLQSWRIITKLPKENFEALDEAQFGPWLPMHLTLNYQLARAVKASGVAPQLVNAAFPDAVGPVLAKVGLAPSMGIGNVANIVPALTYGFAIEAEVDPRDVEIRLVAQHYFSHYVPRFGTAGDGSYHLRAYAGGRSLDGVSHHAVFAHLGGRLRRLGGDAGQLLTASSAMRVIQAMATDSGILAHAPAPQGLPGGYPVRVGREGGVVDLPSSITLAEAIRVNEECQRADGIEHIDSDGTVTFTEREMGLMEKLLGYECRTMRLAETGEWAEELRRKYEEYAGRFSAS